MQAKKKKTTKKFHGFSEGGHTRGGCDNAKDRVRWRQMTHYYR